MGVYIIMKINFNQTKGHRAPKGDKIPSTDMLRGRPKNRAITQRQIHMQTVCDKSSTNFIFDCIVYQMKSVEGITYYMARRTENRWMESQYCHARVGQGRKFRVSKTSDSNIWHIDDSSKSKPSDRPEL